MSGRILAFAVVVLIGIYFFRSRTGHSKQKNKEDVSVVDTDTASPTNSNSPSTSDPDQPSAPVSAPTTSLVETPKPTASVEKLLTRSEFAQKFKGVEFHQVLAHSKTFSGFHGDNGRYLPGVESGYLAMIDGSEMPYRLALNGNESSIGAGSCISIRKNGEAPITGIAHKTLSIREYEKDKLYALILNFQSDHYFFIYEDPNGMSNDADGKSFVDTIQILYYRKQADGKIIFQGERSRPSWAERDPLPSKKRCRACVQSPILELQTVSRSGPSHCRQALGLVQIQRAATDK